MALLVTPAPANDADMDPALMGLEQVAVRTNVKFFVLDAGYDQLKNYEAARNVRT